jgi:hypothetical protein
MKKIGFYCNHAFGLYDIIPIINEYKKNDFEIFIITKKTYVNVVKNNIEIEDNNILLIEDYYNRFGFHFTQYYMLFCVNEYFSKLFIQRKYIKFSKFKIKISNLIKFLNVKNDKVNIKYSKIIFFFYKLKLIKSFPVDFEKLYVVTKVFNPYLITPFESRVHLIIESWDHPSKEPFLINPVSAESWNHDLNLELIQFQSYKNVTIGKALKFRYIEEYNTFYDKNILTIDEINDINYIKTNNVAIYPMCTSSSFFAFQDELNFVSDLALKLKLENIKLYVRPYPLAPYSDVLALNEIKNIYVGLGNKIKDGLEVFDINHMLHKYLIIKNSKYVINLGTTFVFDAALVNSDTKIIQIVIPENSYGDLGKYSRGVHLIKYLHTNEVFQFKELDINKANLYYKEYLFNWLNH